VNLDPSFILEFFANFSASEPQYSYQLFYKEYKEYTEYKEYFYKGYQLLIKMRV